MTSLVVVTCNQLPYLKRCLQSIEKYTPEDIELIIVNQASTDGTTRFIQEMKTGIRSEKLIFNSYNTGCSPGWNAGIQKAEGDPIIVLNDDIVVSPGWLNNLLLFKDKHPNDLFSAHVLPFDNKTKEMADNMSEEWEKFTGTTVLTEFDIVEEGFHGCCIGLPRNLLDAVGLFDEGFIKVAYEDVDYCHRVFKAGRKAQITHSSVMWHYGGVTQNYVANREGKEHLVHNRAYFERKWNMSLGGSLCNRSIMWDSDGKGGWKKRTCS